MLQNRGRLVPQLRMVVAALLSFGIAAAAHLPEAYWAALSSIIVARPQPGAALQAGTDRGSAGFAIRTLQEAQSVGNPLLASDVLQQNIDAIAEHVPVAPSDKRPAERHRIQAHALHYGLSMAARDASELSKALGEG